MPSIRTFRDADTAAVAALWTRVFPDDPPWNAPAALIATKRRVQAELFLVAEVDGEVVGAVMAGFDGVRGWIHHLAVAPEQRRCGIASQLVRAVEVGLRVRGCSKVNLQIRAANRHVAAFYGSLGYAIEERISMGRRLDDA